MGIRIKPTCKKIGKTFYKLRKLFKFPLVAKKIINIQITEEEINSLIDEVEGSNITEQSREKIINFLKAMVELNRLVGLKSSTIARLRKVFGKQSEKQFPRDPKEKKEAKGITGGSGRHGKEKYPEAEEITHPLCDLKSGEVCPECEKGKVYPWEPGTYIRIKGSAPLVAEVHRTEKLRCNLCGKIFEADFQGKDNGKFDAQAKAIIALLHYKSSLPFFRLEKLQEKLNIPIPRSTLWAQVESLANMLIIVWKQLVKIGANGELIYIDDTTARLLSLKLENELNKENKKYRKGMFTTGVFSESDGHQIVLYFTGRNHSGENLSELLKKRTSEEPIAIMSDALSHNSPKTHDVLHFLCLTHGRRNFVDMEDKFKEESKYVLDLISKVYANDAITKEKGFSAKERLAYHQENSAPVMDELKLWLSQAFTEKLVEPNSTLGKGVKYMQRHWKGLSAFLRHQGAPLDTNILEQQLRVPVLNRKNWLFYKNSYGAFVGDIMLSIIKTCDLEKVNAMKYMVAIQENIDDVKKSSEKWLPWNYTQNFSHSLSDTAAEQVPSS